MNRNAILGTSKVLSLFSYFDIWRLHQNLRISGIYHNSRTYLFVNTFWDTIKICFRYSFLGRITEISQTGNYAVLDNSRTIAQLRSLYSRCSDKICYYCRNSLTSRLSESLKIRFYLSPAKIAGVIIVTAVAVNIFLSLLFQKQLYLWSWFMRMLLLFMGFSSLFCPADWLVIKENSIFFRKTQE